MPAKTHSIEALGIWVKHGLPHPGSLQLDAITAIWVQARHGMVSEDEKFEYGQERYSDGYNAGVESMCDSQ